MNGHFQFHINYSQHHNYQVSIRLLSAKRSQRELKLKFPVELKAELKSKFPAELKLKVPAELKLKVPAVLKAELKMSRV